MLFVWNKQRCGISQTGIDSNLTGVRNLETTADLVRDQSPLPLGRGGDRMSKHTEPSKD